MIQTAPSAAITLLFAALLLAPPAAAQQSDRGGTISAVTVGSGSECDYSDLQTAIDNVPDNAQIRLQNETFAGNFEIVSRGNVVIRGGFESCTAIAPSFKSTLDAAGSGRPLEVRDSTDIVFYDLVLENGSTSSSGGGLFVKNSEVTLESVTVRFNQTTGSGGGIHLFAGGGNPRLRLYGNSVITLNEANGVGSEGGGISCSGANGEQGVVNVGDADVFANTSANEGGGVRLFDCALYLGTNARILGNDAGSVGGGVAALGQSLVQGNPGGGMTISNNTAGDASSGLGGAIFAGDSSQVEIAEATIQGNEAYRGGAFFVRGPATLVMDRSSFPDCIQPNCSVLSGNFAYWKGGALVLESGGSAEIRQTLIYGNSADANGSVAFVDGGMLDMEGVVIYENPGDDLFEMRAPADVTMAWSTLADNTPDSGSGSTSLIYLAAGATEPSSLKLYSNIIRNAGRDVLDISTTSGSNYSTDFDCLMSHELSSLSGAARSVVDDPQFLDPAADDYRLPPNSPAVDACDDAHPPLVADIDGDPRGRNVGPPSPLNYDIGADEVFSGLFSDRFEL